MCTLTSLSVDEILLLRNVSWSLPLIKKGEFMPFLKTN